MPSDSASGFRLDVNTTTSAVRSRSGQDSILDIEVNVTDTSSQFPDPDPLTPGFPSINPGDLPFIGGSDPEPRRVEFLPQNIGELQNNARSQIENVSDTLSLDGAGGGDLAANVGAITSVINIATPFNIPSLPGGGGGSRFDVSLPNPIRNIASMNVNNVPFEDNEIIRYQQVTIPEIPGERFDIGDIPDLEIQAELILDGGDENPTVTISVDSYDLFSSRDVTDLVECDEIYSDIRNDIQSLSNRAPSGPITNRADVLNQTINLGSIGETVSLGDAKDRMDGLVDDIPLGNCQSDLRGILEDVPDIEGCAEATDFYNRIEREINSLESEISNLEDNIEDMDITEGTDVAENLTQTIRGLSIEDIGTGGNVQGISISRSVPSAEEIQNEIDDIRGNISSGERQCLQQLESRLSNAESRISSLENFEVSRQDTEIDRPEPLDCGDIPGNLNSRTRSFVQDVRNRTGPGTILRPREVQSIVNEASELRNQINSRAEDRNPCKRDLLSDITSSIQDARESEADSCSEIYPELDNRIDNIERGVVQLGGGVSEPEIENIRGEANDLINDLSDQISQEDQECADQFSDRIQSSLNRLGQEVQTVRIIESIGREAQQRQQEEIETLQEQLAGIRDRAGGVLEEIEQAQQ